MKTKEQKQVEARARRLTDFECYRDKWLEQRLVLHRMKGKTEYDMFYFGHTSADAQREVVDRIFRSMQRAAQDAGIDIKEHIPDL